MANEQNKIWFSLPACLRSRFPLFLLVLAACSHVSHVKDGSPKHRKRTQDERLQRLERVLKRSYNPPADGFQLRVTFDPDAINPETTHIKHIRLVSTMWLTDYCPTYTPTSSSIDPDLPEDYRFFMDSDDDGKVILKKTEPLSRLFRIAFELIPSAKAWRVCRTMQVPAAKKNVNWNPTSLNKKCLLVDRPSNLLVDALLLATAKLTARKVASTKSTKKTGKSSLIDGEYCPFFGSLDEHSLALKTEEGNHFHRWTKARPRGQITSPKVLASEVAHDDLFHALWMLFDERCVQEWYPGEDSNAGSLTTWSQR